MLGHVVGKYRLIQVIGDGGMGQVFLGKHVLLGRTAAIKLLSSEISKRRDSLERFFREAVATSQVKHPGIVEVYDFGHDDNNIAFLVMELLEGESLSERLLRVKRISVPKTLVFAHQLAGALQAAHQAGVVHRDLKPANIFLVTDDSISTGERTKILDFGIAKLIEKSPNRVDLTMTGAIVGTPVFMSPEQCRGKTDIGPAADLYALGCTLYKILTGRPPFTCRTSGEYILAHCTRDVPPMASHLKIPAAVEALVGRLLAKDPADRPNSEQLRSARFWPITPGRPSIRMRRNPMSPLERLLPNPRSPPKRLNSKTDRESIHRTRPNSMSASRNLQTRPPPPPFKPSNRSKPTFEHLQRTLGPTVI